VTRLTTASRNGGSGPSRSSHGAGAAARYNAYLEALAGRLSHELRTPVAVVRSSLENLHAERTPEETRTYVARAEEGLVRLSTILARMTEASRLEQSLSAAVRERFDAAAVVRGCAEGYRLAYAPRAFEVAVPAEPVPARGAADLLAQMLDKLVENAVDFAAAGTAIRISLNSRERGVLLRVENEGSPLPDAIRDSLFDSMVSLRSERSDGVPHLWLGLYIGRLIAEFHGGTLRAENLPGARGVAFEATLARAL
jgi:signal transduction histidine kinase